MIPTRQSKQMIWASRGYVAHRMRFRMGLSVQIRANTSGIWVLVHGCLEFILELELGRYWCADQEIRQKILVACSIRLDANWFIIALQ